MEELKRENKISFGIQLKLLLLLLFVSSSIIAIVVSGVIGLRQIATVSSLITEKETPLVQSIQGALSAIIVSTAAAERALDIDDFKQISDFDSYQKKFEDSIGTFNMFIASITWGSETDAFRRSGNGANYKAWVDANLVGKLVVQAPSDEEAQLSGEISIYHEGFVNNTRRAIEARKLYLTLKNEGKNKASEEAKNLSKEFIDKARHFSELTVDDLRQVVSKAGESISSSSVTLKQTEKDVKERAIIISIVGFFLSLIVSIFFGRKVIVSPLKKLAFVASAFGEGKLDVRSDLKTKDEMETLGNIFNNMAEHLARYTTNLESEVSARTEEIKKKVSELDTSNQLLLKRETELTLANERLQELDKAKSEFISIAAHQLRTPLSAIKWILSLLIDENSENLTPEQKSLMMKGYESNERIISLINEMLVVTRIESGKVQYNFSLIHMEDIIDSILLDFAGQAHVRKIKLAFVKPKEQLPYVNADPEKIRSVVQNLIENSVRYTKDGGEISVSAELEGTMIKIGVKDNGIGIPSRQQTSIFNKFFRADNAVKTQTDGSGLGLFIAKSIVDKHGGKISFESGEGTGTIFYFTLPVAQTQ